MRHGSKPTIRDVAERAGVSLTTVSYVLSGRSGGTTRISQPTQDRVHAAVRELGYVANQAARGMRRGRTDLVAVALADLDQPRDRALATALSQILPQHGYQAVILLGGGWRKFMLSGGADGVILLHHGEDPEDVVALAELADRRVAQLVIPDVTEPLDVPEPADVLGPADADVVPPGPASTPELVCARAVFTLVDHMRGLAPNTGAGDGD